MSAAAADGCLKRAESIPSAQQELVQTPWKPWAELAGSGSGSAVGHSPFERPHITLCPHICQQVQGTDNSCSPNSCLGFIRSLSSREETGTKANNPGVRCDPS